MLSRTFCEKSVRENFCNFHTIARCARALWSLRNFCIMVFWKSSVKTTYLVKSFTVKLISRNDSQVIQKFHKLHTVPTLPMHNFGILAKRNFKFCFGSPCSKSIAPSCFLSIYFFHTSWWMHLITESFLYSWIKRKTGKDMKKYH